MKAEGVIDEYAIAGAMAMLFWAEPTPTYDLDVLVFLPGTRGPLVSLTSVYEWAQRHGYPAEAEHVKVEGIPVQFVPSPNELADEAIESAAVKPYDDNVEVRVVRPEYLIALFLEGSAKTPKRRERAAALRQLPDLNQTLLQDVMTRYKLTF